jgi:phosphotransferase family enzyme
MTLTFEEITAEYEKERSHRSTLVSTDVLPLAYEEITPAWMTSALAKHFPGAEVAALRFSAPDEGTSSRRRIFLEWKPGTRHALPKSVFCKGTLRLDNRYIIGLNGGIEAEVTFYNAVRPTLPIVAPEAYFAAFHPRSLNSIIVMRDIGEEVRFRLPDQPLTKQLAESEMRLLGTLHGRFYESPELTTTLSPWRLWEDYFTITVEKAGFGPACARGVDMAEHVIPPRLFHRAAEIWPATLRCVDDHRRLPRMLIHSDVHLKNWFVAANGEMGLNDWQCSSKGNWSRDLAYAISTALTIEDRRAWEKDLLRYYLDRLHAAGGAKVGFDEAWSLYRQQLFAALAWWTGTLGQPPEAPKMQPPETSITFIERMAHAIDDLDALDAF